MIKQHSAFKIEDESNLNKKIWRYMTIDRFESMLKEKAIYFSRSDLLGDDFEGSYSKPSIEQRKIFFELLPRKLASKIVNEKTPNFYKFIRNYIYINCWHLNETESLAMWTQYAKEKKGIALQTTIKKLKKSIENSEKQFLLGFIKYIDFEKELIPEGNLFNPFFYKRKEFEHENEIRIATSLLEELDPLYKKKTPGGIKVPVNNKILIDKIYLSPYCSHGFERSVSRITNNFSKKINVMRSKLDSKPMF